MASKPHALLVPYPLQGHIIPTVHLAIKLASNGVAVTFVNTEAIHHQTSAANGAASAALDIFAATRASGLDIRYELVSDGLPVDFDRSLNHDEFMGSLLHNISKNVEILAGRLLNGDRPITCIIADTFFVWHSTVAKRLGVASVSFWTEPALVFSLYYHMDLLRKHGHFESAPSNENPTDVITYIPGVDAIKPSDLMSYLQSSDIQTVVHRIIYKAFDEARGADFILCNTVQELEPKTILALQLQKPFYAVGPIFPAGFTKRPVATSLWTESDCTQWLDTKPTGSVLYISFGSYAHVTKKELEEIAHGVLASNVNFIWVIRPDIVSFDEPNPLPAEFVVATKERGLIVPWCCQTEVLAHRSIGGFLTHCGWNSILESIWCGIPMLCFPLLTDQFTNRKLVVQDWRIGIDLGGINSNVCEKDVSEKIRRLMGGKEGEEMRKWVEEVRGLLESAIGSGGSSQKNFESFVEDLKNYKANGL